MRRRAFIAAALGSIGASGTARPEVEVRHAQARQGRALLFPRDYGAHPEFRTEWWYATGWIRDRARAGDRAGAESGFQVTFFRHRLSIETGNPSAFAPRQLVFAHAALADPRDGRLRHDQRAARAVLGVAGFDTGTTRVWIDDWRMALEGGRYTTRIASRDFALELELATDARPLPQGDAGWSRKGRRREQASHYYSRPQLAVSGRVTRGRETIEVEGIAWLDHEWSSTLVAPEAAGWDWAGLNLDDGGSLMAFRMRGTDGADYWAGGTRTTAAKEGGRRSFGPESVRFEPLRRWRSPRTGVEYPVAMRVVAGGEVFTLEPLMEDQELDSRASTGVLYWEGAVRVLREGTRVGRGYLELTGYGGPIRF